MSKNSERFADYKDLLKAYENLQAEFTRRCQRLKALEEKEREKESDAATEEIKEKLRQKVEDAAIEEQKEGDEDCTEEAGTKIIIVTGTKESVGAEENAVGTEKSVGAEEEAAVGTEKSVGVEEKAAVGTEKSVGVEENAVGTEKPVVAEEKAVVEKTGDFTPHIYETVVEQPCCGDSARLGYNGGSPQPIDIEEQIKIRLADPKFIDEVIMTNSEITSRIIAAYLTSIAGTKNVTTLKSGAGGMYLSPIRRPKSLAEARALAEKLLE